MRILIFLILTWLSFSSNLYAVNYQTLDEAQKAIKMAQTSKSAKDILEAGKKWHEHFVEKEKILIDKYGEDLTFTEEVLQSQIYDSIVDYGIDNLPLILKNSVQLLVENLYFKVASLVISPQGLASPLKELRLLNQQVTIEIVSGLTRIYPREMNSIIIELKNNKISFSN